MNLNKLRDEAYSIAKANGWHEKEYSDEHYLMLIITEVAEAVQADRKDKHADVAKFKEWQGNSLPLSEETRIRRFKEDFEAYIKNSVEDELADVVIRCLDLAGVRGIDLSEAQHLFRPSTKPGRDLSDFDFAVVALGMVQALAQEEETETILNGTILGIMQFCDVFKIDIEFFIRTKMEYNRLRGYHHGGKKY